MTLVLLFMAMFPALALAQPVFFDDFDGDELLPHWSVPPDDHWEYEVSGGMLHVTDLLWPSDQHFGNNYVLIGAGHDVQTDFRADVWMGWDAGDGPHELIFRVKGPQNQIMAEFGYSTVIDGSGPVIVAAASNQAVWEAAPEPGMYHFTVTRVGEQYDFYFNNSHFASFVDLAGTPAANLNLWFLGPYPGQMGTIHIDRVRVVPSPGVLALLAVLGYRVASERTNSGRGRAAGREP